jgi:hypothetical protein
MRTDYSNKNRIIWAEMARRKNLFHPNEEWNTIKLWGLFSWGMVSRLIKSGELITDGKRENKTVWVRPSVDAYKQNIEPLLGHSIEFLSSMAGWDN